MFSRMSTLAALGVLVLVLPAGRTLAQQPQKMSHEKMGSMSEPSDSNGMSMIHGGHVVMSEHHRFEVLFTSDGACVYLYDDAQKPIDNPKNVMMSMTLQGKDQDSKPIPLQYEAPDAKLGRTQGYFSVEHPMTMKNGEMKAVFEVKGLQDKPVEFHTPVTMGERTMYACPMGDSDPAQDPGKCPHCGMQMRPMDHGKAMSEHMGQQMKHGEKGQGDAHGGGKQ